MDIIGIQLKDVLEKTGCPVCNLLKKHEMDLMGEIFYEHVNNPSVRERFKESLGLCTYHAWELRSMAYSNLLYGSLGVAIIYEHMLSVYLSSLKFQNKIVEGKCFLCKSVEEKEEDTIGALVDRIEELFGFYESSEAIFCKKHYAMLRNKLETENPQMSEILRKVQIKKLETLKERLNRFIEKFDYRSTEPPTEDETQSVTLSIESLKGLPLRINFTRKRKKTSFLKAIFNEY